MDQTCYPTACFWACGRQQVNVTFDWACCTLRSSLSVCWSKGYYISGQKRPASGMVGATLTCRQPVNVSFALHPLHGVYGRTGRPCARGLALDTNHSIRSTYNFMSQHCSLITVAWHSSTPCEVHIWVFSTLQRFSSQQRHLACVNPGRHCHPATTPSTARPPPARHSCAGAATPASAPGTCPVGLLLHPRVLPSPWPRLLTAGPVAV